MDDNSNKPAKRRSKFAGKEDISRETADNILSIQINQFREISYVTTKRQTKFRRT
jgi:hypothetical protein